MYKSFFALTLACVLVSTPISASELRIWSSQTGNDRLAVISYLCDLFSALNPDITVQFTPVHENNLIEKLRNTPEEQRPTLIHTVGDFMATLGHAGYLDDESATALVDRFGRSQFYEGALNMLSSSHGTDKVWGVPLHGWAQGIWYRQDLFDTANLSAPKTWADIEAAAAALHDPENGKYGILLGTAADSYAEQIFTHLALSNGVRLFDDKGALTFNTPNTVETLKFIVRLSRYTPPEAMSWRARDYYLQGRLGMMFYSTFIMDDLALPSVAANSLGHENFISLHGAPFDPNLVKNTRFQGTIHQSHAAVYGRIAGLSLITGTAANEKDMAQRFIHFLFQPDNYVTWLHMAPGGMLPVRRGIADSDAFLADPQGVFKRYGRKRLSETNNELERVTSWTTQTGEQTRLAARIFENKIIPRMILRAVHNKVPAEQAVAEAAAEMQALR